MPTFLIKSAQNFFGNYKCIEYNIWPLK